MSNKRIEKKSAPILDKEMIFDTDFYYPFLNKDGTPDLDKEIFEFCVERQDLEFEVEDQFLLADATDSKWLRYLIVSITKCEFMVVEDVYQMKAYKVRCLFKGRM